MEAMAHRFIDDFPSELNLHLWLGFSMAMLVITRLGNSYNIAVAMENR